jgi:hypothetical protein
MDRKEYSTIVTARRDVNFGWLRNVGRRRSGRCLDTERDDPAKGPGLTVTKPVQTAKLRLPATAGQRRFIGVTPH